MTTGAAITLPGLTTKWLGRTALHFDEIDSTNTWLKARMTGDLPRGTAVLAALQTAGKGRLGRHWQEEQDAGLALSFLLRGFPPASIPALPLAIGLAVCLALEDVGAGQAGIKWSNDVLLAEQKICGILCESRTGTDAVVAGIGVNLLHSRAQLDAAGLVYATSLHLATKQVPTPPALAASIANRLEPILEQIQTGGFAAIRPAYCARCLTLGRQVRLLNADGTARTGQALTISPRGDLICRMENGAEEAIGAGEVSVRGLYGYV